MTHIARISIALSLLLAPASALAQGGAFTLSSPDIPAGSRTIKAEQVFNGFGCTGPNVSPALQWSGAPAATKSFALIVHDPDAPTGVGGFTHWIVYNIPATVTRLEKGAGTADGKRLPPGTAQSPTSFGASGYGGPCPPAGDKPHRYIFTLYALNVAKIDVPANASQAVAGFTINGSKLATATFTGMFGR